MGEEGRQRFKMVLNLWSFTTSYLHKKKKNMKFYPDLKKKDEVLPHPPSLNMIGSQIYLYKHVLLHSPFLTPFSLDPHTYT